MATGSRSQPDFNALFAELMRLGERVGSQHAYIEVLERKIATMLEAAGAEVVTLRVDDPIDPRDGGVSLRSNPDAGGAPYEAAPARTLPQPDPDPAEASWWPRPASARAAMVPGAGWRSYTLHKLAPKVVGISVCGLPRPVLAAAVAGVASQQGKLRDFIPVFLTDSTDFDVFRRHGFVFEYLPGPAERARYAGTASWAKYAASRRSLLERKWGLDTIITIGPFEFGGPAESSSPEPS